MMGKLLGVTFYKVRSNEIWWSVDQWSPSNCSKRTIGVRHLLWSPVGGRLPVLVVRPRSFGHAGRELLMVETDMYEAPRPCKR
jgi:hypothetical protein